MRFTAPQDIYVILDPPDTERLDALCNALEDVLCHVNLTANLYLVCKDLADGMPRIERIQKVARAHLRENRCARIYVHFIHGVHLEKPAEAQHLYQYYYQGWKRSTLEFDREGYAHQEVPRMILLPVVIPDKDIDVSALEALLDSLKKAFMMPGLYLNDDTLHLTRSRALRAVTEKLYYGARSAGDPASVVFHLSAQRAVEALIDRLESGLGLDRIACNPGVVVSASDGMVYACIDQFLEREALGNLYAGTDPERLTAAAAQTRTPSACLACLARAVDTVADSPMPKDQAGGIGAVLYRLGTLYQDAGAYMEAVMKFEASLAFSPAEQRHAVYFRVGLCRAAMGDHEKAVSAFRAAESAYAHEHFFHFYLGTCYFQQGDYSQALAAFQAAFKLSPPAEDRIRIALYLATCFNNLARYSEAVTALETEKEYAGNVKELYSTLAYAYFQLKNHDKAIENLEAAVALDPDSAIDYASLGANYREKGEVEKAAAMYEKALALDPGLSVAQENLTRLRKPQ
ncbi:MAG: tetratricopeptide repeat protein [Deltaproteobacteria bacterium]|nr:tetratricopeptide repeat protein [Deltaproteobacteria bacterium]